MTRPTTRWRPSRRLTDIAACAALASCLAVTGCTLELDSDRAAARRLAERIERAVERSTDTDTSDLDTVQEAVDLVFDAAILDDIVSADAIAVSGLDDTDADGLDDDGLVQIDVHDAAACLTLHPEDVDFEIGPCPD